MADTDNKSNVTLAVGATGPVTTESLSLDPEVFPFLTELLTGPEAEIAQQELTWLIGQYWQARSVRREIQVLAKLVVDADDGGDQIAVYVQDISKGGVRLAVLRSVRIALAQLMSTRVLLQVDTDDGEQVLDLPATFVRLAGHDDKYFYLAFSFESLDATLVQRIDQLSDLFVTG